MVDVIGDGSAGRVAGAPGEVLSVEKMPGHWLLARLGKRVLRPGGLGLTREMLSVLDVRPEDEVVDIATSNRFIPPPLRSVIALRFPSCHARSPRSRATSSPRSKPCNGPPKGLPTSGCGLLDIPSALLYSSPTTRQPLPAK